MIRTHVLKHLPRVGKGERGGSKGYVRGGTTTRGAMWKGGYVGVIEGRRSEEMNSQILLPHGVQKYLLSLRGGGGS